MSTRHQHAASPTEKQTRMLVSSVFWHQHTTHNTQHSAHSNQVSSIAASQLRGAIFQPDRGSFVCCIPLVIFAVATARSNAICGSRGSPHPIPSHSIPARHPTCLHFNEHNSRIYDEPQPESSISRFLFACFVSELIWVERRQSAAAGGNGSHSDFQRFAEGAAGMGGPPSSRPDGMHPVTSSVLWDSEFIGLIRYPLCQKKKIMLIFYEKLKFLPVIL